VTWVSGDEHLGVNLADAAADMVVHLKSVLPAVEHTTTGSSGIAAGNVLLRMGDV
jgi:hypothetical protein